MTSNSKSLTKEKQYQFLIFNPFLSPSDKVQTEEAIISQKEYMFTDILKLCTPFETRELIIEQQRELFSIPPRLISFLQHYSRLEYLGLHKCEIDNLEFLVHLKCPLNRLSLDHNPITVQQLGPIGSLDLQSLSLINCQLSFTITNMDKSLQPIYTQQQLFQVNLYANPAFDEFSIQHYKEYRIKMFKALPMLKYLENLSTVKAFQSSFECQNPKMELDELGRFDLL